MRRFDVLPITSEFSEKQNIRITALCYIPYGYIYLGTDSGDILLYKYDEIKQNGSDTLYSTVQPWSGKCVNSRCISRRKSIDKIFPITLLEPNYSEYISEPEYNNIIGEKGILGVVMCLCGGSLYYLDYTLKGPISILYKGGITCISQWKDTNNLGYSETKFCFCSKRVIYFYNTIISRNLAEKDRSTTNTLQDNNESTYSGGINPWFLFASVQSNKNSKTEDDTNNSKYLTHAEFVCEREQHISAESLNISDPVTNIEWCNNWCCFSISNIYYILNINDEILHDILHLDNLSTKMNQQIVVLPNFELMLVCQDNLGAFFDFLTQQPCPKPMIQWPTEHLTNIVLSAPYILGGTRYGTIYVYSLANYSNEQIKPVQTLELDGEITCMNNGSSQQVSQLNPPTMITAVTGPMIIVSTTATIYALVQIPFEESVQELVNKNQGNQALSFLRTYCSSDDLLYSSLKFKIQCLAGWNEFKNLRFKEAFKWFEEAHMDPRVLITLFWRNLIPKKWLVLHSESQKQAKDDDILYEYARISWLNNKSNVIEDISPSIRFQKSLIRSLINNERSIPWDIKAFIEYSISLNNKRHSKSEKYSTKSILKIEDHFQDTSNFPNKKLSKESFDTKNKLNYLSDKESINDIVEIANSFLRSFLFRERRRYLVYMSSGSKPYSSFTKQTNILNKQSGYTIGRMMDIVFLNLLVNSSNEEEYEDNKEILLSILSENYGTDGLELQGQLILSECLTEDCEDFLIKNNREDILAIILANQSSYFKALEMLESKVTSPSANSVFNILENGNKLNKLLNIYQLIYSILLNMCRSETTPVHVQANLLKRYSIYILQEPYLDIVRLFTLKPITQYPLSVDEILDIFSNCTTDISLKLTRVFLEYIIKMNPNLDLKHKLTLINIYIDESITNESKINKLKVNYNVKKNLSSLDNNKQNDHSNSPNISTMVYNSFSSPIGDNSDEYPKLITKNFGNYEHLLLTNFVPSQLLLMLENTPNLDDNVLPLEKFICKDSGQIYQSLVLEYITILFRSNKHLSAIEYIIEILGNFQLAEIYSLAWNFHEKYALANLEYFKDIYSGFNLNENSIQSEKIGYLKGRYRHIYFFSKFKMWQSLISQNLHGNYFSCNTSFINDANINQWIDLLNLSSNELSLVGKFERNNSNIYIEDEIIKILTSDSKHNFNMATYIETNGLKVLVEVLVRLWKKCNLESKFSECKKLQYYTIHILNKYPNSSDLHISNILPILPDEWPIMKLINYLKGSLSSSMNINTTKSISMNLSAISYLRCFEEWASKKSKHITLTQDMICPVCSLKFGSKQCAVYPNGSCIHAHCLGNENSKKV
ncbi:uncharacterized protein CMU_042740 [Cryptosporidium muris RN66]|uniref:CNH domain-containing protein n=1 Tax=Cryptosporidium muris (strain RN66) TaxID=441375 RepID=B6AAF9_CRYMR|nr:uncharacterized protein CMU_042740 [Cryptosporidium muris RN66]EEA05200.1 hypothetical protein, conserved [Cryptosporidium muris RN66]|eukprot:XP_002139549.1 hypothetical protein [Cryptosporidium muris RN66]